MELPYKELVYILETVLNWTGHLLIILCAMFYALLLYGGLLVLFVKQLRITHLLRCLFYCYLTYFILSYSRWSGDKELYS
jgi:hypothetical protein